MTDHTVYVQINIGRGDLNEYEWAAFRGDVTYYLRRSTQDRTVQTETHYGTGHWTDEATGEEVTEESAHISALVYRPALDGLRAVLRSIKHQYRQDAIALIVGSELI